MKFRTPRRAVSSRTKRRCRAIKEFFQKAIGSPAQSECKTNTSGAVSVAEIKSKIDIIEDELAKVNRRCRDLVHLENSCGKENTPVAIKCNVAKSTKHIKELETQLLYKSSKGDIYSRTDDTESYTKSLQKNDQSMNQNNSKNYYRTEKDKYNNFNNTGKKIQSLRSPNTEKYVAQDPLKKQYISCSCHHIEDNFKRPSHSEKLPKNRNYSTPIKCDDKLVSKKELRSSGKKIEVYRSHKKKYKQSEPDEAFISEIIRRQYKPVKLFGRRDSDFSQFTAPFCRDQEISIRNDEGSELCSCCFEAEKRVSHRYCKKNDMGDVRSICDARLYSSKKNRRYTQPRTYPNNYNNSDQYDLIPVKEKSSPKTRRKFIEENMMLYGYSREVPPSPRTQRPRLNLKAQSYERYDDATIKPKTRRHSPLHPQRRQDPYDDELFEPHHRRRKSQETQSLRNVPENDETLDKLKPLIYCNEQTHNENDTTLVTQASEKTDKTLCEIKDILQNFLQEIKKDCSQNQNPEVNENCKDFAAKQDKEINVSPNMVPNSGSFNYGVGQCNAPPFVSSYNTPCCYPILPICPVSCVQNGYVMPTSSYTCCNINKEQCRNVADSFKNNQDITHNETQELIKEIYKAVAQTPVSVRKQSIYIDQKNMTSRSVGSNSKTPKQDVMIETPAMRCYSKSCEAIASPRQASVIYNSTNPSYSDTILERLSLEVTQSSTESDANFHREKKVSQQN
ncbi:uncharacterized protein LOC126965047 [Leptidea sinapis]|uniref:uncharacterized protein LOC126965047 n=1 Tax=Leptidea sinapis TaxID=189913 RepID=UPI0021C3964C|nr:uncharacterized protein LOC126965047 [Leptidea sinapis]